MEAAEDGDLYTINMDGRPTHTDITHFDYWLGEIDRFCEALDEAAGAR